MSPYASQGSSSRCCLTIRGHNPSHTPGNVLETLLVGAVVDDFHALTGFQEGRSRGLDIAEDLLARWGERAAILVKRHCDLLARGQSANPTRLLDGCEMTPDVPRRRRI